MFAPLITTILFLATGLAGLIVAGCVLGFVVLLLMNLWGIMDPRAGAAVKGNMLKVCLTAALAGLVTGASAIFTQMMNGAGG